MGAALRVLHVMSDTNFGGAGRYLLTLLNRREYTSSVSVDVACPPGMLLDRLKATGTPCFELPGGDRSLDPGQIPSLFNLISRGKYDVVHTHASLTARLVARFFPGVKIIFTKHTMDQSKPRSSQRLSSVLHRWLAHRVICPSKAVLSQLADAGLPHKMLDLIYNGVDAEEIRAEVQRPGRGVEQAHETAPVLVTTGRLEPEKGHATLIRAMPLLLSRYPGARLVIAGDGSLRDSLTELCEELDVSGSVTLPGFVPDVAALLSDAAVFVLPSLQEALGISLLEAMAAGIPCVASTAGGIPEIITNGIDGILVEPGDHGQTASAVLRLLGDQDFSRRLSIAAHTTIDARFSARVQAEQTVATYIKAIGR